MTLASHRLLLDLMALEAEFSRVIMLNSESPLNPENRKVSQGRMRRTNSSEAAKLRK